MAFWGLIGAKVDEDGDGDDAHHNEKGREGKRIGELVLQGLKKSLIMCLLGWPTMDVFTGFLGLQ